MKHTTATGIQRSRCLGRQATGDTQAGAGLPEVANLRWTPETNDLDLDSGIVRVMGKGRRERIAFLSPKAVKALDRYLRQRARHHSAALPHLWLGQKGRMTTSGITQILRRRGRAAGVDRPRYAKSAERERAIAAARRVNVGDRL